MSTPLRFGRHPYLTREDRGILTFRYDGRPVQAYEGETIAAALHAAGVKVFSRSVKYHRPRGLLCVAGNCPNCLLQVDGVPNVRACTEPARGGMEVRSQTGWPSVRFDLLQLIEAVGFLFPVGFPYRYFIRPRWLYHWWEWLLRHLSGHGALGAAPSARGVSATGKKVERRTEVLVVGGGPAGLAAAQAAASLGVQVALVDEGAQLGGSLCADTMQYRGPTPYAGRRGYEIAEHLRTRVLSSAAVQVYPEATAFGVYDDGVVGVRQKETLVKMTTERLVVATGAYENTLIAENWDRPGVLLASGVQRMLHTWQMWPGSAAVVVSTNDYGLVVAAQLLEAGAEVKAVADARGRVDDQRPEVVLLRERGVPLLTLHTLKAARGWNYVMGADLIRLDGAGRPRPGTELLVPCDTIVLATGFSPANELVFQATAKGAYTLESTGTLSRVPYRHNDMCVDAGVYVAGNAAGVADPADLETALLEGELAGLSAALGLGARNEVAQLRQTELHQLLAARRNGTGGHAPPDP